jgi:hypothetical protein
VPIVAFFAAPTVTIEVADPPTATLTLFGLNVTGIVTGLFSAARDTVPEKPWMPRTVIIEVAFPPCGTSIEAGLTVKTKLPPYLWASVNVRGRRDPLTVTEPRENIVSSSRALSGTRLVDRLMVHSLELNPS